MRTAKHRTAVGLILLLAIGWPTDLRGGEEGPNPAPEAMMIHGGVVKAVNDLYVETAFKSDRIEVYAYDRQGTPLSLSAAGGSVHIEFQDPARSAIDAGLTVGPLDAAQPPIEPGPEEGKEDVPAPPEETEKGLQDRLAAPMDLARLAEGEAVAKLTLDGLPGGKVDLEVSFRMARIVAFNCPTDGVSRATPGTCEGCGARLLLVRSYYGCRRHPTVALDREGNCWKDHDEKLEFIVEPAIKLPGGSSMDRDGMGRPESGEPPTEGLGQR